MPATMASVAAAALLTKPSGRSSRRISCAVRVLICSIEWSIETVLNGTSLAPTSLSASAKPFTVWP